MSYTKISEDNVNRLLKRLMAHTGMQDWVSIPYKRTPPQPIYTTPACLRVCAACVSQNVYVLCDIACELTLVIAKQARRSDCAKAQGGYSRSGRHHRGLKGRFPDKLH